MTCAISGFHMAVVAGTACDAIGCIGLLADGRAVSIIKLIDAFGENCQRAAMVVRPRQAQLSCTAKLIERKVWRARSYCIAMGW